MSEFYDRINSVYTKRKVPVISLETIDIITLNKWLSYDRDNVQVLRSLLDYMFYVEPLHYYYLLFFNIGHKGRPPFLTKIEKDKTKENTVLVDKILYVTGWSNAEFKKYEPLLEATVFSNKKYWKEQLGIGK